MDVAQAVGWHYSWGTPSIGNPAFHIKHCEQNCLNSKGRYCLYVTVQHANPSTLLGTLTHDSRVFLYKRLLKIKKREFIPKCERDIWKIVSKISICWFNEKYQLEAHLSARSAKWSVHAQSRNQCMISFEISAWWATW